MTLRTPPPSASIAAPQNGEKLHAPSAARNSDDICALIQTLVPDHGTALEIASGTGQHVTTFAAAMPNMHWHPTDVDPVRLTSIAAYINDLDLANIAPPVFMDATTKGWHATVKPMDLIYLVNLLHLISADECRTLIHEAAQTLTPNGALMLYGPFKRAGVLTSDGDAGFDADLRAADPEIGYKDDLDIRAWLSDAGFQNVEWFEMPANNLVFVARSTGL
jgi:hypothetical protein